MNRTSTDILNDLKIIFPEIIPVINQIIRKITNRLKN